MDRRVMAFGGSVLLLLGAFLPAVSVPMLGSISYFDNGKGDGIFIVLLALLGFVVAARNRERFLLYIGAAAGALILAGLVYLMYMIERLKTSLASDTSGLAGAFAGALSSAIQLQWGWALLLLGALLVISAGVSKLESTTTGSSQENQPTPTSEKREYFRAGALAASVFVIAIAGHVAVAAPWTGGAAEKKAPSAGLTVPGNPTNVATVQSAPVWEASVDTNAIDGSTKTVLRIESTKPVLGRYGQEGPATLILRCRANRFEAYVVTPGQLESDYSTHEVAVRTRFDEAPPVATSWTEGTGGEAIFVPQPKAFVKRLLTAQRFLLEYPPFRESPKTVEFAPSGLAAELPKLAGCSIE